MFKSLEKYRGFIIAVACLITAINSWGNHWVMTGILVIGVIICSLIGISDIKEHKPQKTNV